MKYIVYSDNQAVIFGNSIPHKSISRPINAIGQEVKAVSAGFVDIAVANRSRDSFGLEYFLEVYCYGESVGLKLQSRAEDSKTVKRIFEED